jgi:cysteine desulfurase NifS/selenium donor protein
MNQIYIDYNATTPIAKEVADAMRPFLDNYFGNPSSTHTYGAKAKLAVEKARSQVARLLNCQSSEIVFTSGGTESNNYAIKGIAFANRNKGNHIITSSIEHPAVFEVCKYLESNGFEITYLPVDEYGIVNAEDLKKEIKNSTILVSIMHANNEVGSIQPISELSEILKGKEIYFHTDAAQSIGKINTDVQELGVDLLSIAGHKLYAPKGIGALYIRNGIKLEKLLHGADHEQNLRAGTENVLEIVGLGMACEIAKEKWGENTLHYQQTRDYLFQLLKAEIPEIKLNGHPDKRLPNTLSISFPNIEANTLISRLEGVAASAGAACHSESIDVSAVLEAMHIPLKYAMGTIRFSTGRYLSLSDIKIAANEIISVVNSLKPKDKLSTNFEAIDLKEIKLTHYTHGLGCACKIEPQKLEQVLKSLPPVFDTNVLVGTETSDDATVYKLSEDLALVQTLDFFTPIVDNPYQFGAIAAANALSDIYAMGAKPIFALNIVGFPKDALPLSVLEEILRGATDKAAEAGIAVLGGHTIEDPEPKYGMVVSGIIHPDKIIRNKGAKPGDVLLLTKPIGTGILSTAMKRGLLENDLIEELSERMSQLNKIAAEKMRKYNPSACTDVSGFGLLGHLRELSTASGCNVELQFESIPIIRQAYEMAVAGVIPGGTYNNLEYVKNSVDFGKLNHTQQLLLSDAQTSGGLLLALKPEDASNYLKDLESSGILDAKKIGSFTETGKGSINII